MKDSDLENRVKSLEQMVENLRAVTDIYKEEARGWQKAWAKIWAEQVKDSINGS